MEHKLFIYNSLSRKKEQFIPLNPPNVGLYVCGPTVYSEPHLGHVRMAITYDILYRYLITLGYKVRYVRNITDVGHLEDELAGEGEDRISKKARLEQLEPMEIVQKYKNVFLKVLDILNTLPPSIEPQASGHIIEQQQMISGILEKGYAYEVNGSVYFDIDTYNKKHKYGKLSGRNVDDMLSNTRNTGGQSDKRNPLDFALWKKASPEHIMQWPSAWSNGFPGWHLECSAMSTKYLGKTFDIHGGGMDLLFPHHECELAQSVAANGKDHVRYWMHNNMITIDGQKMARSLNNFITLRELFTGEHEKLERAYSPMTVRFFILRAHYKSTLDFSNSALQGAEIALNKLFRALEVLKTIKPSSRTTINYTLVEKRCWEALNDDLNTSVALASLFDGVHIINRLDSNSNSVSREEITEEDLRKFRNFFENIVFNVLGLKQEDQDEESDLAEKLMQLIIDLRLEARANKDYATSDIIRDRLADMGIALKDGKEGTTWEK